MTLKILICDDEKTQIDILTSFLDSIKSNYEFDIKTTTDSKSIVEELDETNIDIAFLDIEMEPYNGIEVGRKIRKLNKNAIIVYITGFKDYALNAFEISAFNYIIKPITEKKFNKLMKEILQRYEQIKFYESKDRFFTFKTKDNIIRLNTKEIYCFEKILRKIKVYTRDETFEFYGTIKDVAKELEIEDEFILVHQGYILNKSKIMGMDTDRIYLKDINLNVPVSRRFKSSAKTAIEENLFS